ncbi:unnamed protein product [Rhodiola kirilowii]
MQVRRQLQDIKQGPNETMYDYLEKFNRLERSCCTLALPEKLIIEYLIDGLRKLNKMLLDASAGGSIMNLSLSGIRRLITDVAENARFREETTQQEEFSRTKNVAKAETPMNCMPEEMKQMKKMMIQILRRQPVQVKPCEFYGSMDHKIDACPTLMIEEPTEVNAVVGYQRYNNNSNDRAGPNRQYNQATSSNWRNENHPPRETQQATPQSVQSFYQPPHRQCNQNTPPAGQYQQRGPNQYLPNQHQQKGPIQYQASSSNQQGPSKSLEETMKELAGSINQLGTSLNQYQAKTDGAISDLTKQMSQLTTSMSALTNETGRRPSQTIQNPKENVNAVTLRSRQRSVSEPTEPEEDKNSEEPEEERTRLEALGTRRSDIPEGSRSHPEPRTDNPKSSTTLSFPVPARVPKQHVMDKDVFELFSKVEINIPLLECIKQVPKYAKFLKELCTNRRKGTRYDQELMSRNISAVMQRKVPPKCGDPGTYTIPCTIGNIRIENCMLDLGASINVLPFSLYSCLRIGPLEPTSLTIQMADRSCK